MAAKSFGENTTENSKRKSGKTYLDIHQKKIDEEQRID
jgi:hypothetical protein